MPPDSGFPPYSLEAQVAVLTNEVKGLRRDLENLHRLLERDVVALRSEVQTLQARKIIDEHAIRELCRDVVVAEAAGDTSNRDYVMRIVTFAVSIGTIVFVLRGGR